MAHIKVTRFSLEHYKFNLNQSDVWFQGSYNGQKWINLKQIIDENYDDKSWNTDDIHNDYFDNFHLFMTSKNDECIPIMQLFPLLLHHLFEDIFCSRCCC